jgi:hypothetical protein
MDITIFSPITHDRREGICYILAEGVNGRDKYEIHNGRELREFGVREESDIIRHDMA